MGHNNERIMRAITIKTNAISKTITAENPTGEKGNACKATLGTGASASRDLGIGYKVSPSMIIKANSTFVIADIKGEGIINSCWFGGDITRDFILRIYWDDSNYPAVECPLPDFFGNGWINNLKSPFLGPFFNLNSMPICINPNNSLMCFWQMPFKKSCKITLENRTDCNLCSFYQINYSEEKIDEDLLYFHAQFHRTNPIPFKNNHIILNNVQGQGNYVGTSLSVGLNSGGNWWGEGEVKFYIDGDKEFPSIASTGTEDYFGGSFDWEVDGKYTLYSTPFCGMHYFCDSDGLYNHQQRFAMYRWHLLDPIHFHSDLHIEIQDLGWYVLGDKYKPRQDDFSSVAFFYLNQPQTNLPFFPDRDFLKNI